MPVNKLRICFGDIERQREHELAVCIADEVPQKAALRQKRTAMGRIMVADRKYLPRKGGKVNAGKN